MEAEFVYPDYGPASICGLANGILKHYGLSPLHPVLDISDFVGKSERLLLFIVDGLGVENLKKLVKNRSFNIIGKVEWQRLTSTFPSTTATAITTLSTGLTPIEHGIIGYILYFKEFGTVANAIEMCPIGGKRDMLLHMGLKPERFLQGETIFQKLSSAGVEVYSITHSRLVNTGFNRVIAQGAHQKGFYGLSDMCTTVLNIFKEKRCPVFVNVYWGLVDTMGHRYGADGEIYQREATLILRTLEEELLPRLEEDVVMMIVSDHGQIPTSWEDEIWWSREDEIYRFLKILPTGEQRMMYLHSGDVKGLMEYLMNNYDQRLALFTASEAVSRGLLGEGTPHPYVFDRMGDLILVARKRFSFNFRYTGQEQSLGGRHGGLSREEMIVPLIVLRR